MPAEDYKTHVRHFPVALLLVATAAAPSQRPGTSAAFVLGRVVDAGTGRPIAGAIVSMTADPNASGGDAGSAMSGTPARPRRVLTDDQGRFLFRDLSKGTFLFTASAWGFLDGGFGQTRPEPTTQPFALGENERVGNLTIRLWKEATLSGRVVDEAGDPVVDVSVLLSHRERAGGRIQITSPQYTANYGARTDDRGVYVFGNLKPGEYLVSVPTRTTAVPAPLVTADRATLDSMRASGSMALSMGMGAMSPAVRVGDFVLQTSGQGHWGGSNALAARLPFSMRPDGTVVGYPTTFYPSATSALEAVPITLKPGDERTDVELQLRPVVMQRLPGTVIGPNGPEPHMAVHLIPAYAVGQQVERTHEAAVTATDARGAFTFPAVPPGEYVARAWRLSPSLSIGTDALPPDTTLWGEAAIVVGETPPERLTVQLQPGLTLSGRIEFDGTAATPRPTALQPMLARAFEPAWPLAYGNLLATRVSGAWEFTTQGVPPGKYFANLPNNFSPSGWHFESATVDGKDLVVTPVTLAAQSVSGIVIRFSDRRIVLSGTVTDAAGKPDANALVLVFPSDYRRWIESGMPVAGARAVAASQAGGYTIAGIRPGEYLAIAVNADLFDTWRDRPTIERLASGAMPLTLARGDLKRLDLRKR
jgi:protocatechuate 3,4-dioxygenase beta subunit